MIDLHCHILPGVDDGAKTMEDALAMARAAAIAGTRTIVATPHMLHPQFHVPGALARERHAQLVAAIRAAQIPVEVVLAGEIHWSADVQRLLDAGELIPLCAKRRYILFELPYSHVPSAFRDVCWRLQLAGIFPVLAHPERITELQEHPEKIADIRAAGIPVQVTAMSLTGEFGRKPRKTAETWLASGQVDLVASDGHSVVRRPPTLDGAARILSRTIGDSATQWVTAEVPRRLLAGEPVLG
jgi:protein-tyrosine phosphatase